MEYRNLQAEEIQVLQSNDCWAENWDNIKVKEGFIPKFFHRVMFYGDIRLGKFAKDTEISKGFFKHSGINNATLRNVTVGDNCLIENISNFINNYDIGNDCYISNICTMQTNSEATFGEGNIIAVLNEMGEGNIFLHRELNSQLAAFMVKYDGNKEIRSKLHGILRRDMAVNQSVKRAFIGNNVTIINTKEITDTVIFDCCQVDGASRLSNCTVLSAQGSKVFIGTGVICENSIISDGSVIINSVKMQDCFVGESCEISNGFTASASVFFANSYMSNVEACAAFCGPFSASHHKSSLLIGGQFSFYNAGSATNFSNHAYKMGPIHYGILERGTKTSSGSYILMPATIGTFSVCLGKLMHHPDTRNLPFSYLIALGDIMYLVPGRNLTTVGLYRDIRKWPKRDKRPATGQKSIVNFDWLSPFSVGEILEGKKILENLRAASGSNVSTYNYHEYVIKKSALDNGIRFYDMALRIYMGAVLKRHSLEKPVSDVGLGKWSDLSGLLIPDTEEKRLCEELINGTITDVKQIKEFFIRANGNYNEYRWRWTYKVICDYYGIEEITEEYAQIIHQNYVSARRIWIDEIKKDARKEYALGDVETSLYDDFMSQLDKEVDFENQKLYM